MCMTNNFRLKTYKLSVIIYSDGKMELSTFYRNGYTIIKITLINHLPGLR